MQTSHRYTVLLTLNNPKHTLLLTFGFWWVDSLGKCWLYLLHLIVSQSRCVQNSNNKLGKWRESSGCLLTLFQHFPVISSGQTGEVQAQEVDGEVRQNCHAQWTVAGDTKSSWKPVTCPALMTCVEGLFCKNTKPGVADAPDGCATQ